MEWIVVKDLFVSEKDVELGKVVKRPRLNPTGEDIHLDEDGVTIHRDEDKIVRAQRIFKDNYWKPGGPGAEKVLKKYKSCPARKLEF